MLGYLSRLSLTRKIQWAVALVGVAGMGALLVIYAEAWTVRDRYRVLLANHTRSTQALEAAVASAAHSQSVLEYLEIRNPDRRARMTRRAWTLAESLRGLRGRADSNEERRWGTDVDAIHRQLIAQADELIAMHDLVQASRDRLERGLDGLERAAGPRARMVQTTARFRRVVADYIRLRTPVGRDDFERSRAAVRSLARPGAPTTLGRLLDDVDRDARTLGHHAEALRRGWSQFVGLQDRLDARLAAPVTDGPSPGSTEAVADFGRSVARLSAAATALTVAGVVVGLGAVLILRALVLPRLRELAEGAAAIGAGRLDHQVRTPALDEVGQVALAFNDMTARLREHQGALEDRIAERTRELVYLANHDALTGLVNRAGFGQSLEDALRVARRRREALAVLLLDLDGFKSVNDTLGHEQGDRLLHEVARRLRTHCREVDVVARLGGDEFCIVLNAVGGVHGATDVAERLLHALLAPVELLGRSVTPRASIGIAMCPDDAQDAVGLLRAADTAMYAAKQAGKHRYQFYNPRMTRDVEEQMAVEAELRAAVEHGAFELFYQPKVALASGRLTGVEALIRWRRRGHGLVPPDAFIPTVERMGLIEALGDWVLRTACEQARRWRRAGLAPFDIAVNISPTHFAAPGFVEGVTRILAGAELDPRWLEIELTESVMRDSPLLGDVSRRLRALGVRIAIDDFGAGFSSLTALRHTPVDTLKIDRQFVQGLLDDPEAPLLLGTVLGMAGGLQLMTVAEGVETLHEVQVLQALGCASAQGYYFSPPVPPESIPALARAAFFVRVAAG